MFNLIKNYLKKLFRTNKNETKLNNKNKIGSLSFDLFADETVNIKCFLSEFENMSEDEVVEYAESYALLLHNTLAGLYTQSIIDILNKNIDQNNHKDVLFLNNLFSFWAMFHVEKRDLDKNSINEPLVKPSNFFKKS